MAEFLPEDGHPPTRGPAPVGSRASWASPAARACWPEPDYHACLEPLLAALEAARDLE